MPYDITPYLRRRNIFGAGQQAPETNGPLSNPLFQGAAPSVDPTSIEEDPTPNPYKGRNFADIYSKIMGAEPGPATKAYRDFISQNEPQSSDYEPTKKARFFAAMSGIGESIAHGPRSGYEAVDKQLSKPYDDALMQYKLKSDRYAKAADEEQKDVLNRVKTFRDILSDNTAQDKNDRENRLTDAQIANYKSEMKTREADLGSKGYSFATRETDGHRIAQKVNPLSPNGYDIIDLGKVNPSYAEKEQGKKDISTFDSNLTLGRQKNLFDFTNPKTEQREKNVADYKAGIVSARMDKAELIKKARDASNPDRELYSKAAAYRDMIDEHPELKGNVDLNTLTHTNNAVVGPILKQYQEKYKVTPGNTAPAKSSVTSSGTGNNDTTTTKEPPAGMKPGGKWIKTAFGDVYQEP